MVKKNVTIILPFLMLTDDKIIFSISIIIILAIIIMINSYLYPKKPTTEVSGIVTEPDGTPAVGVVVTLLPDNISSTTDATGKYDIVSNTNNGSTGTLTATDANGNKATASVLLDGNGHTVALALVSIDRKTESKITKKRKNKYIV